jgi:diguanylate cyclase (GGDEF)-like protein
MTVPVPSVPWPATAAPDHSSALVQEPAPTVENPAGHLMQPASPTQVVHGLESIIDAVAGVLAEQSLTATLEGMARALGRIVPFTSLAIYEADHRARVLVPVFAVGRYVEQTLADRPPFDASIAGSVVRSRQMAHVELPDPRLSRYQIPDTPADEPEAIVVVPLVVADDVIGTLNVWREDVERPRFDPAEAQLILRFATLAALAYANAQQRERLREQALTDALTGLANRRHFRERLLAELARSTRDGRAMSLILFDVDDFKSINDRHGHPAGDAALRGFAAILRDEARVSDVVCRIGGEEFAVILPNTTAGEAARYAVRVLLASRTGGLRPGGRPLTASAGIANTAGDGRIGDDLLRVADDRLLAAKSAGKDRIESGLAPAGRAASLTPVGR